MRHTTCFDTIQPLIYHLCTALKAIVCVLCHITSYTTPQPLSISIKLHQHIAFRYSSNINRVTRLASLHPAPLKQSLVSFKHSQYEAHDLLRYTPAPYMPPLYSFKANSMHFMSYNFLYDPLSLLISINLQQRIAFRYSFNIKKSHYEAHDLLRYTASALYSTFVQL